MTAAFLLSWTGGAIAQDTESDDSSEEEEFRPLHALVVDLRPGAADVRTPSQAAFIDALSAHGELRFTDDKELASLMGARPYSAVLERGRDTLKAAILAFGGLDCASTSLRASQAILDLAAAAAAGVDAREELRQAYLYRFLCADRQGTVDEAMSAASMLRLFIEGDRPKEISETTWDKYPLLDAQSNGRHVAVEVKSEPDGATIWIDHREAGTTPSTLLLSEGTHLVSLGHEGKGVSQEIKVTAKGSMSLPLAETRSRWEGIEASLTTARKAPSLERPRAMGDIMAATLAEVAFVMREPGRVAVWILPDNRRSAELVGHAPNAAIAGKLALQGLEESRKAPGLDPNMPLLRETPNTTTRATATKRWWVYGIVLGAAAIGAGLIVVQDLSEDRQRIEVTLP
jgi:hypothetical protein